MGSRALHPLRSRVLLVAAAAVSLCACGGRQTFLEDENWSREKGAEGGAWREVETLSAPAAAPPTLERRVDGVRLELSMAPQAEPTARCACLDVAVGTSTDPVFRWDAEPIEMSSGQIVLAIRGPGARCPDGSTLPPNRRPSIRAVDRVGPDVVVVIEELREGRPLALGVVTTMPDPGGSVYVRPASAGLPYGASPGSNQLCRVYTRSGHATLRQP